MVNDYIVKDSSVWNDVDSWSLFDRKDTTIHIGIVRSEVVDNKDRRKYEVEVFVGGQHIIIYCTVMRRWGGLYNFEEHTLRPYKPTGLDLNPEVAHETYTSRAGDVVVVGFLGGDPREGVILGGLDHPGREQNEIEEGDIAYLSRFNGIETKIRDDGTYTVTYQGAPVTEGLDTISATGKGQLPPPVPLNPLTAGAFFGFDTTGSYTVTDGADNIIKIIKGTVPGVDPGSVNIVGGAAAVEVGKSGITGKTDSVGVKAGDITISGDSSIQLDSSCISIGQKTAGIFFDGTSVAIGSAAVELLELLGMLIDELGTLVVSSPVGPCSPLMGAPTWAKIIALQVKLKTITGGTGVVLGALSKNQIEDNFSE